MGAGGEEQKLCALVQEKDLFNISRLNSAKHHKNKSCPSLGFKVSNTQTDTETYTLRHTSQTSWPIASFLGGL